MFLKFFLAILPILWLIIALSVLKIAGHKACLIALAITAVLAAGYWKLSLICTATAGLEGILVLGEIFQEIIYITIPSIKPQMLFGAVMAIVNTFQSSGIGTALSGSNPTPNYAGQLIVTHIEDYGFLRYEMGYAAAISVVLLVFIFAMSQGAQRLFGNAD